MKSEFVQGYRSRFAELIGCSSSTDEEATPVGVTRMGDMSDFVDELMEAWTERADRMHEAASVLPKPSRQALLNHRFCTYAEYMQLHTPVRSSGGWAAPVFRLLNIADAGMQNQYQKRFPQSRKGYFNLMEVFQPQMRAFFFQRVQNQHSS